MRRCPEGLASAHVLCPLPEMEIRCKSGLQSRECYRSLYTVGIMTEDQSAKSEAMYKAYGKLIKSGENLYGDIQKEKGNGDEMEMRYGDGIGGRGSGMRNMTHGKM
ncbi:hypothetical protein EDB19DRAFT_1826083 [Suillus lakei]|nr:hypothetical protein EDB19DRAFT_1826083 [Suillus lakei]